MKTFTVTPEALSRYGVLHTGDGRKLVVTAFRSAKPGEAVLGFEGVRDRTAAEALKGAELFVDRNALPDTAQEEFYHADLIGLEARDSEGRILGKVSALHNFGASDVIELQRAASEERGGDSVHLAFTRETVPVINIADGYIIVAVPEDDEDSHVE